MISPSPSHRPTRPIQNQSRGVPHQSKSSCLSCPDTDNLSTAELSNFHGCQLMKSAATAAPVHHTSTGLASPLRASSFSCKYTIFKSCSYTNFDPIKSCSYTSFQPRKACSYTNFSRCNSPQSRCTQSLTVPSMIPLKLNERLNQYTQTRRRKPSVVCSVFFQI